MLDNYYFGVRGFIWIYFFISVFGFSGLSIYWFRETIRRKYYELRYPEKLLKVVLHYKAGMFKEYWRLIPDNNAFIIDNKHYPFDEKTVSKNTDMFTYKKHGNTKLKIDNVEYEYDGLKELKKRWSKYPEIHFIYNVPKPLTFDMTKKDIQLSSKELQDFKDNDLFYKLLNSDREKVQGNILLLLTIVNTLGVAFILARMMEWI